MADFEREMREARQLKQEEVVCSQQRQSRNIHEEDIERQAARQRALEASRLIAEPFGSMVFGLLRQVAKAHDWDKWEESLNITEPVEADMKIEGTRIATYNVSRIHVTTKVDYSLWKGRTGGEEYFVYDSTDFEVDHSRHAEVREEFFGVTLMKGRDGVLYFRSGGDSSHRIRTEDDLKGLLKEKYTEWCGSFVLHHGDRYSDRLKQKMFKEQLRGMSGSPREDPYGPHGYGG